MPGGRSDRSRRSRLFSLLLVFALLLQLPAAHATGGDPNIEGGGGGMGGAIGDSAWNPGDDGVRVSVMQGATARATFDLSNIVRTRTQRSFRIHNKLFYKNGGDLSIASSAYHNEVPPSSNPLPTIIPSSGGSNNIAAIRSYFTDETVIRDIAAKAGMDYEELISGDFKLLLEPIAYFKYNGVQYAMTATEAAKFDVAVSRDLYYQMSNLTHQNQPLAMFLEHSDLGIAAWDGTTTGRQSNIDILNKLGCGVVSFTPEDLDIEEIPLTGFDDYTYRTNTDVITSVVIKNDGGHLTPSSRAGGTVGYATFHINGTTYRKQVICPSGSHQLVWVKWHTPSTAQDMIITVVPPNGSEILVGVSIVDLEEKTPPNPGYDGPLEGPGITHTEYRPNFRPLAAPDWGSNTSTSWDQWIATLEREWIDDEQWVRDDSEEGGHWEDCSYWEEYWDFSIATYEAGLSVDFELKPDQRVPTAVKRGNRYIMGSGYGVNAVCGVTVSAHASSDDVTPVQHVLAMFPESDYKDYFRLLTPESRISYRALWQFKSNPYSYYGHAVHFTPIWYPDTDYTVPVAIFDAWTPGGMLYATAEDTVKISGSAYDDWYIRVY